MPRSILTNLHWIFNPVFEPYVQRDCVSALLFFLFFYYSSFGRFCFSGCWIGRISPKKENLMGMTPKSSTINTGSAWTTPRSCQKIKSKFVILLGAWPIRPFNIFMSGPARIPLFLPVDIQHTQCPCRFIPDRYSYKLCGHKTTTEIPVLFIWYIAMQAVSIPRGSLKHTSL